MVEEQPEDYSADCIWYLDAPDRNALRMAIFEVVSVTSGVCHTREEFCGDGVRRNLYRCPDNDFFECFEGIAARYRLHYDAFLKKGKGLVEHHHSRHKKKIRPKLVHI